MSDTKWTDGPWVIIGEMWEGDGAAGVGVKSEESLIFVSRWTDRGEPGECCDQDYHDARLISAAPELYEALEYCLESLGDEFALPTDCIDQCMSALAKARGESCAK